MIKQIFVINTYADMRETLVLKYRLLGIGICIEMFRCKAIRDLEGWEWLLCNCSVHIEALFQFPQSSCQAWLP